MSDTAQELFFTWIFTSDRYEEFLALNPRKFDSRYKVEETLRQWLKEFLWQHATEAIISGFVYRKDSDYFIPMKIATEDGHDIVSGTSISSSYNTSSPYRMSSGNFASSFTPMSLTPPELSKYIIDQKEKELQKFKSRLEEDLMVRR